MTLGKRSVGAAKARWQGACGVAPGLVRADEVNEFRLHQIGEESRRPRVLPVPHRAELGPVAVECKVQQRLVVPQHGFGRFGEHLQAAFEYAFGLVALDVDQQHARVEVGRRRAAELTVFRHAPPRRSPLHVVAHRADDRAEQVHVQQLIDAGTHRHDVAVEVEDAPVAARDLAGNQQAQVGCRAVAISMGSGVERVAGRHLHQLESAGNQRRRQLQLVL
ncbi:MAG: hypothetical protein Q8O08_01410 [Methyloversatilis sp.]|nr:hypothetical protein [Methyloversatilis sp.]MDP2867454.1 hypothetical protein [Methyloversatilis sp.]MDP3455051.1 hypothetical protein [Methyloversatilis sp.]